MSNENSDRKPPLDDEEAAEIEEELNGKFTMPRGSSEVHRRRLLGAIAGAGTVGTSQLT